MKKYIVHKHLLNSVCFAQSGRVVLKSATQTQLAALAKENPNYVHDPNNPDRDSIMKVVATKSEKKTKRKKA